MNPLFMKIDSLKNTLHQLRPLSKVELQRLREEFIIETTYNSNAIEGNTLTLRETALILQEGITIAENRCVNISTSSVSKTPFTISSSWPPKTRRLPKKQLKRFIPWF